MTANEIDDFLDAFLETLRYESVKARIDALSEEIGGMKAWQDRARKPEETIVIDGVECSVI